jgi:DHA1 family bicyclomycin/chloramphenicol resistance-like MFS transporter
MSPALVVLLLTLLLGIQPVTTDLYLPTLPTMAREFGATQSATQQTLAALIVCFGLGQLACGPLSDRHGRRPVLLAGLALYTLASIAGALSRSIEALVAWRALQGLALAAAVTCARSIVRDLYAPAEGARVMSSAMTGLGVIAFGAPLAGGLIATALDWHAALLVLALFGAATLAFVALRFPESLAVRDPRATRRGRVARNRLAIARNPAFRAVNVRATACWGGLFVMLASGSFIYIDVLGASRIECGAAIASASLAYIAGTLLCRRLLVARGLRSTVAIGGALSLAGGATTALLALAGVHTLAAIVVPFWLYAAGHGIHQPCAQVGAIGPFPEKAGAAAALTGFSMMATAYAVAIALGASMNGTVYPLALGVGAFALVVATTAWTLVQRHGEPRAATAAA